VVIFETFGALLHFAERVAQTPHEIVAARVLKHAQEASVRRSNGGRALDRTGLRLDF
jgi:hypothetical protein